MTHLRLLLALVASVAPLLAQGSAELRGEVTDPSGAVVPGAAVILRGPNSMTLKITTNLDGSWIASGLARGQYTIRITAPGFTPFEARNLNLEAGRTVAVKSQLTIAAEVHSVTVADVSKISVDPDSTAAAIVLKGEDLDVLSDNPDDLASDLQALAGPAAGPSGAEIFIDGFSGAKLPPKSSIREIRINQNPFSAEYDRLGFGRIEVFTKPGSDRLRGQTHLIFGDESLNSRNPFSPNRAPYQLRMFGGNLGGPLSKKSSFFVDLERRDIDENAVIRATVLDDGLQPALLSQSIVTPQRRLSVAPRLDYQLAPNHTLVLRYQHLRSDLANQGVGQFNLASRAFDTTDRDHMFQLTETAVLSPKAINETRLQVVRSRSRLESDNTRPVIQVLDAFTAGGAQTGLSSTRQDRIEVQNLTSFTLGTHLLRWGGRVRASHLADASNQNFSGTFVFAGGLAPQLDVNDHIVMDASGQPSLTLISSLERYRRTLLFSQRGWTPTQIRQFGGGASQFTLFGGDPNARVNQTDVGVFCEDAWRLRPNLTLNYGLRYEAQTNLSDRRAFGPRLSLAWGLDGGTTRQTRTVLRAGFGLFYDRFPDSLVLQTIRYDGSRQQQYFVSDPDSFPNVPSVDSLGGNLVWQTRRRLAGDLRAPYIAQSVIGLDRQLPWKTTVAAHFVYSRGVHMLRSRNTGAPLPGTPSRPYGESGNTYVYESTGFLKHRQLLLNFTSRSIPRMALFGFYVYGRATSDTDGASSFPVNQYDLSSEYGRSSYDVRHRFMIGGSLRGKWGLTWSPFIVANSGPPFNIVTGRDNNQDTIFNDRPSFATDLAGPDVVVTRYGAFNLNPNAGQQPIPRNFGSGPTLFAVNLRMSKTWGFGARHGGATASGTGSMSGPGPGGPPPGGPPPGHAGPGGPFFEQGTERRFSLTLSVSARNLLNRTNLGTPIGNLSSPLFGQAVSLAGFPGPGGLGGATEAAGNRRVVLELRFSF